MLRGNPNRQVGTAPFGDHDQLSAVEDEVIAGNAAREVPVGKIEAEGTR